MQTEVNSKTLDGADIKLIIKKPSPKNYRDSEMVYNKTVREALKNGALLRQKLNDYLIEQEIWNAAKENQYKTVLENISKHEEMLKTGGIKLSQAKEVAVALKGYREELRGLVQERQAHDTMTAEGQGDNARFNYLVAVSTFKEDGKTLAWSTIAEYDDSREPYAVDAASALAKMIYNKLPENQFLKKFKFVNNELKLINKDGHLIDEDGRLINESGRFVAYREDGTQYFVNRNGEEVDEKGEKLLKALPFLDDDGNPIIEESTTENTEIV